MAAELIARHRAAADLLIHEGSPHPGLVFERFARILELADDRYKLQPRARYGWLQEFLELAKPTEVRKAHLQDVHARLDVLTASKAGLRRELPTVWRFVSGLGNPSASETGMAFDAACGVPHLPGSSVKGLTRAGAELADVEEQRIAAVLGRGPDNGDGGAAGGVVFLDALPLRWPKLEIDVITRHHDAEALRDQKTPLDTNEPNPVHFLTVASREVFAFRLLPAWPEHKGQLDDAWRWLAHALKHLGAGGKTAVGYGQMSVT